MPKMFLNYSSDNAQNIREMATNAGIKYSKKYTKKELCKMLGIKYKYLPNTVFNYTLTNIKTNEIKSFKSARAVGRNLKVDKHHIQKSDRTGRPLVLKSGSYMIKKID